MTSGLCLFTVFVYVHFAMRGSDVSINTVAFRVSVGWLPPHLLDASGLVPQPLLSSQGQHQQHIEPDVRKATSFLIRR